MHIVYFSSLLLLSFFNRFAVKGNAEKAEALFVFGDSYADTGNHDPYNETLNQPWRTPYGFSWPGYPAGRFSSGKIQTDLWADILGLPCPVSYEQLKNHGCGPNFRKIRRGVNFAVGGSAIFDAFGFTTVPQQVKQFKKLIAASPGFDSHKLSRSVVLISAAGNDYGALRDRRNGSIEGLEAAVKPVVRGIIKVVKDLYECGLRNFVVSNIAALGCAPEIGKKSCDPKYNRIIKLHSTSLTENLKHLRLHLKEISIIIPDMVSATEYIFSHHTQYGLVDLFVPCCDVKGGIGMCGEVDEKGKALFEVCDNVHEKFFWDFAHPTHRAWYALMELYAYGENTRAFSFIEGPFDAIEWLHSLGFLAFNISFRAAD